MAGKNVLTGKAPLHARCFVAPRQAGKYLVMLSAAVTVSCLGFMALARRDHKVELLATYPNSAPLAVWRVLTDHASEPQWLPVFSTVVQHPDQAGHPVWTHSTADGKFRFTLRTIAAIPERRYERLLLRDDQPRDQSWDGRWVYELEPVGTGTLLKITEYGWTDGLPFFVTQRVFANPDAFLRFYAAMIGRKLDDVPAITVVRSH